MSLVRDTTGMSYISRDSVTSHTRRNVFSCEKVIMPKLGERGKNINVVELRSMIILTCYNTFLSSTEIMINGNGQ